MNEIVIIVCTLLSGFLVIYHHLGYPLILRLLQKQTTQRSVKNHTRHYTSTGHDQTLPSFTIVIPAYNEQQWIADKIRNLAILDYPPAQLKIIIACDGCNDSTAKTAAQTAREFECHHLSIEIRNYRHNRGKVALINEVVQDTESELVALSDVSALISADVLLIAAARFNDPQIGVLNGQYHLLNPGSAGEANYWRYQSRLKASEAALGSTLGSHGAFYIFRRSLFTPLEPDTINDDFILPMKIVAAGYRSEYDNNILALEQEKSDEKMDYQRRQRIAAGNCQQLLRLKKLLLPNYGGVAFSFISGKGLRVLMPFLMFIALAGSLTLVNNHFIFLFLAALQVLAYLLASWQILLSPTRTNKLSESLAYLVRGHFAGLIGSLRYLLGLERPPWKRVEQIKSQTIRN